MPENAEELLYFLGALVATAVGVLALHYIVLPLVRGLARRTDTDLDDAIIKLVTLPVYLGIVLAGAYVALLQLPQLKAQMGWIAKAGVVTATVIGFIIVLRLFNGLVERRVRLAAEREDVDVAPYMGMIRKLVNIVLVIILIVLILDQLNYQIGPILASMGIAGIAVALALQDTLGNIFAGFYMLFDRPVKVGDYVELESGEEGFVEEIGWRNTKIRPWSNNIIVIPNSKLSESILVNHYLPEEREKVYVRCGVGYNSDLEHVERVCMEVGKDVMARVEGSDTESEPVVRFKEFGDSNINFVLVLWVRQFGAQYRLSHECIKALHKRFREEGIEISWPVRQIVPAGKFEFGGVGPEA